MIPQIIGTFHPTMPIKYTKICRFFPISRMLRFGEIQYYSNSVFIVLSDRSLIRGCRVSPDGSMSIFRMLGGLEITNRHQHLRQHWMMTYTCCRHSRVYCSNTRWVGGPHHRWIRNVSRVRPRELDTGVPPPMLGSFRRRRCQYSCYDGNGFPRLLPPLRQLGPIHP